MSSRSSAPSPRSEARSLEKRRNTEIQQDVLLDAESYTVRRKLLSFLGQKFYIYDPDWELVGFVKQKAFRLKEDLRVYTGIDCTDELLVIKARQIIDFSAAYDVIDPVAGEKVGALRRKGLASTFVRDTWELLDEDDRVLGMIQEDSVLLGLVRRFLFKFLPQGFTVTVDGEQVASFQQNWNIFVPKLRIDFFAPQEEFDRRLGLGAAVLMSVIEGRQR